MKVLFVTLFLCFAGAFGRTTSQEGNGHAEGPACPIDDPLASPGPSPINVTLDPIALLVEGSIRGDLIATGLSTLSYTVDINELLLTATFRLHMHRVDVTTRYEASGYVDARPLRPETIPSGNFTGRGAALISGRHMHVNGSAKLFVNVIGNKVTISDLVLEAVSFESIALDLGADFTIGGQPVNWSELSANLKANFELDFNANKTAITDKVRLAANNIVGKYTLAELIGLLRPGGGEECEK